MFSVAFHESYFVVSISQVQQRIGYCPQVKFNTNMSAAYQNVNNFFVQAFLLYIRDSSFVGELNWHRRKIVACNTDLSVGDFAIVFFSFIYQYIIQIFTHLFTLAFFIKKLF